MNCLMPEDPEDIFDKDLNKEGFLGNEVIKVVASNRQKIFQHGLYKSSRDTEMTEAVNSHSHQSDLYPHQLHSHTSQQYSQLFSHTACHLLTVYHKQQHISTDIVWVQSHSTGDNTRSGCHSPSCPGCTVLGHLISTGTQVITSVQGAAVDDSRRN